MAFPLLGFTINIVSLLGLVLAIGLVVDDAIVVVEAVQVNIGNGMSPKEATIDAMGKVTSPIIATTIVLLAVFVPVSFSGGITGRLFQQFAITISVSVLFSTLNALTLSPALCALLLKPHKETTAGIFGRFNRWFDRRMSPIRCYGVGSRTHQTDGDARCRNNSGNRRRVGASACRIPARRRPRLSDGVRPDAGSDRTAEDAAGDD